MRFWPWSSAPDTEEEHIKQLEKKSIERHDKAKDEIRAVLDLMEGIARETKPEALS